MGETRGWPRSEWAFLNRIGTLVPFVAFSGVIPEGLSGSNSEQFRFRPVIVSEQWHQLVKVPWHSTRNYVMLVVILDSGDEGLVCFPEQSRCRSKVICIMRRKNIATLGVVALSALLAGGAQAQTLTNYTSFGNNGHLASAAGDITLDQGNLTRGMAVMSNGQVIVVNRQGGVNIRVIDGVTGTIQPGEVNDTGITGGTFTVNMAGASGDGKLYVANLTTTAASSALKVYEWSDLSAAPTVVYNSTFTEAGITGARLGDTLDVRGSGNNIEMVLGLDSATGGGGYLHLTRPSGSGSFGGTYQAATGAPIDAHRLGITFGSGSNVYGTQGGAVSSVSTIGGPRTSALVLADANERFLDSTIINGVEYLATLQTDGTGNRNRVRVYDMTNPAAPVLVASGRNDLVGDGLANVGATGQIRWGAVNGSKAVIYAMNTNNGIQAYEFDAVPEPATMTLLALGALAARRRRKNSK